MLRLRKLLSTILILIFMVIINACGGDGGGSATTTYYEDADGDGYGNPDVFRKAVSQPTGYITDNSDCDDNNTKINPKTIWYKDVDCDGYSDGASQGPQCARPSDCYYDSELIDASGDCDDSDDSVNPGAAEITDDGIDQDCDGVDSITFYADTDGDTYGDPGNTTVAPSNMPPTGYVTNCTDCDDTDATINPGAAEICDDGIDNDCDGLVDNCTFFFENFEGGWGSWWASNGSWQVGTPTVGPGSAYSGTQCAGTVLDGDYPNTDSDLVSPSITLPTISAGEEIHLRFWHWFSIATNSLGNDTGRVYIQEELSPGVWGAATELTRYSGTSGGVWTRPMIDLSAYAGLKIRIRFGLVNSDAGVSSGWYVDDVSIEVVQAD